MVGEYKDPVLMTGFTIPSGTFDSFTTNSDPGVLLASFEPGVSEAAGKAAVEKALKQFPGATVRTNAEYKAYTESQVNGFLYFMYVLLAMTASSRWSASSTRWRCRCSSAPARSACCARSG